MKGKLYWQMMRYIDDSITSSFYIVFGSCIIEQKLCFKGLS